MSTKCPISIDSGYGTPANDRRTAATPNMELLQSAYQLKGISLRSLADARLRQQNSETLGSEVM